MGLFTDMLFEEKCKKYEEQIKEAYGLGFRDGRLCPAELRPCEANGKQCLFHRFVDDDQAMLKINAFVKEDEVKHLYSRFKRDGIIEPCCSTEIIRRTLALVEYPDGSLGLADPMCVQFLDREEVKP